MEKPNFFEAAVFWRYDIINDKLNIFSMNIGIKMPQRIKKTHPTLLLGLFISWLGGSIFLISTMLYITSTESARMIGVYIIVDVICFTPLILISIVLFILWRGAVTEKEDNFKKIAAFIKASGKVTLDDIAREFGISVDEARDYVITAIEKNYLTAYMKPGSNEIYTREWVRLEKAITIHCPNCGKTISGVYKPGDVAICPNCGTKFIVVR